MRKIFLLMCCLAIVQFAVAQFKLGVKAGLNIANQINAYHRISLTNGRLYSEGDANGESITRFHASIFTDIHIATGFIFRPQLNYSEQGYGTPPAIDYSGNMISGKTKVHLHYINIPLQLLYSPLLSFGKPWIGVGPYAGILLGGKATTDGNSYSVKVGNDDGSDFKRFDFGISSSLGFLLNNGILIGGDYDIGLTTASPNRDRKNKNSVWSIYVGYRFSL